MLILQTAAFKDPQAAEFYLDPALLELGIAYETTAEGHAARKAAMEARAALPAPAAFLIADVQTQHRVRYAGRTGTPVNVPVRGRVVLLPRQAWAEAVQAKREFARARRAGQDV